jgi:hypothetical protein
MEPNCAELTLKILQANDERTKRSARQRLEEICKRYLPFRLMQFCGVMNPLELYKICEEARSTEPHPNNFPFFSS